MMSDQYVSVPRELLQKLDDLMYIMTDHDSYPRLTHKYGKDWWNPINDMRGEVCTLLAAPAEDVRAVVDDPVYQIRSHGSCCWEDIIGEESLEFCKSQPEEYESRTLYRRPQRKIVLPERRPDDYPSPRTRDAWNACIDECKLLNGEQS